MYAIFRGYFWESDREAFAIIVLRVLLDFLSYFGDKWMHPDRIVLCMPLLEFFERGYWIFLFYGGDNWIIHMFFEEFGCSVTRIPILPSLFLR